MFQISWMYSENFDYWKYHEQKSHFDRLGVSIDKSIASRVEPISGLLKEGYAQQAQASARTESELAGIRNANEQIGSGIESLNESLNESLGEITNVMEDVRWELSSISMSIDVLSRNVVSGFEKTIGELRNLSSQVQQLIEISKTPEQTWALEQFSIACEAYSKSRFAEANSFVNRAISGDANHSGYPLEHRFFMLLGAICLGDEAGTDFIDLERAGECFSTVVDLCSNKDRTTILRASKLGALSYLLRNDYETARRTLANRKGHSLDVEGHYLDAKIRILSGLDDWQKPLQRAIEEKPRLALLAASDKVFLKHRDEINAIIDGLVADWSTPYKDVCERIRRNLSDNAENRATLVQEYARLLDDFESELEHVEVSLKTAVDLKKLTRGSIYSPKKIQQRYASIVGQILFEIENANERIQFVHDHNLKVGSSRRTETPEKAASGRGSEKANAPAKSPRSSGVFSKLIALFDFQQKPEAIPSNSKGHVNTVHPVAANPSNSKNILAVPESIQKASAMRWIAPEFV